MSALLVDETAAEFLDLVDSAAESAYSGEAVGDFAERIGSNRGISGYMYHTVAAVLNAFGYYESRAAGAP